MPYRQRTPFTLATEAIPPMFLRGHNTLLLIQDMQLNMVHPECGLGRIAAQRGVFLEFEEYFRQTGQIADNIAKLKAAVVNSGMLVAYTRLAQRDGPPSLLQGALGLCASVSDYESRIVEGLAPASGDLVMNKRGLNAFHGTCLEDYLRDCRITTVLVTGVITEFGIRATAASAQDLGFQPLIVADGTASLTQATQTRTLQEMAYGLTKVRSTGEVLTYLSEMRSDDGKRI